MDVFRALADPIRRDLLRRIGGSPARVVDLAATHDVSRPAVSKHLRILQDAGLVRGTDIGRERHYTLDATPLGEVSELLHELTARRPPISPQNLDALDTETHRAARDRRRSSQPDTTEEDIA